MRMILAKILVLTLLVLGCLFFYIIKWSPRARLALANVENSKKLEIGMPKKQVVEIMGMPERRYTDSSMDSVYFYIPPFAASSGIDIILDKEGKVSKIHYFE